MKVINVSYITELFLDSTLDVGLVLSVVELQREVDWTFAVSMMEDTFLWYDWNTGLVVPLPVRDFRQVTLTADEVLANFCVLVLPAVGAHMAYTSA